jgi:hypothetical protein
MDSLTKYYEELSLSDDDRGFTVPEDFIDAFVLATQRRRINTAQPSLCHH